LATGQYGRAVSQVPAQFPCRCKRFRQKSEKRARRMFGECNAPWWPGADRECSRSLIFGKYARKEAGAALRNGGGRHHATCHEVCRSSSGQMNSSTISAASTVMVPRVRAVGDRNTGTAACRRAACAAGRSLACVPCSEVQSSNTARSENQRTIAWPSSKALDNFDVCVPQLPRAQRPGQAVQALLGRRRPKDAAAGPRCGFNMTCCLPDRGRTRQPSPGPIRFTAQ
jgi:hypothetical protein